MGFGRVFMKLGAENIVAGGLAQGSGFEWDQYCLRPNLIDQALRNRISELQSFITLWPLGRALIYGILSET